MIGRCEIVRAPTLALGRASLEAFDTPASTEAALEREPRWRVAAHAGKNIVFLSSAEVWAFEARNRLCFVHSARGEFEVDASLTELEASAPRGVLLRVHRNWLANRAHIRELECTRRASSLLLATVVGREGTGLCVPVARVQFKRVRDSLLLDAVGLRTRCSRDDSCATTIAQGGRSASAEIRDHSR